MSKHSKKRRAQQIRRQKQAERRAKREAKRPKPGMLRRNQEGMAKRLLAGEVPVVMSTAWGLVEGFVNFVGWIGLWEVMAIDGERFKRKMVGVCQLLATYELKVL